MRYTLVLLAGVVGCGAPMAVPGPPADVEEKVTFATHRGPGQGRLYKTAAGPASRPGVVVVPGDHGLTDQIQAHARRLAKAGYVVLAVDLYRGEKIDSQLDAHIMDRGLDEDRVRADLHFAVEALLYRDDLTKDHIALVGWDTGGGYALDSALADPRVKAVVTCYGRLTTDADLLRKLTGPVLAIVAGDDAGNPPATVAAFEKAMAKAGKTVVGPHVFAGCRRGFMNPTAEMSPPTPAEVAADAGAWNLIEAFLAAELSR